MRAESGGPSGAARPAAPRPRAAIAACALAAVIVAAPAGAARAQGAARRDVAVESEPAGADVYLNSKDDGSVCRTPCTVKAPVGESIIIIELANHLPVVEQLVVPRRGKAPTARFKLTRAIGAIVVRGPAGAAIRIGDEDRGKAPARIDVDAGPHTITLTLGGRVVLQDLVEVEADQEVIVRGKDAAAGGGGAAADADADADVVDVSDDPEPGAGERPGVTGAPPAPARPRGAVVAVAGLVDVGFRRFDYRNNMSASQLRQETESGQVMAGPQIEVWPGRIAGIRALGGLALVGRIQFPVNEQPVEGEALSGGVTTFWQSFELSARQRWTIGSAALDASVGFVRDQHQFNATDRSDLALLPDADYRSIRIGGRAALRIGALEPYLAAENRVVLSGGRTLEDRFSRGASASGLRLAAGVGARRGPFTARLEGAFTRYAWTFRYDADDMLKADGAVDAIGTVSVGIGYAY